MKFTPASLRLEGGTRGATNACLHCSPRPGPWPVLAPAPARSRSCPFPVPARALSRLSRRPRRYRGDGRARWRDGPRGCGLVPRAQRGRRSRGRARQVTGGERRGGGGRGSPGPADRAPGPSVPGEVPGLSLCLGHLRCPSPAAASSLGPAPVPAGAPLAVSPPARVLCGDSQCQPHGCGYRCA